MNYINILQQVYFNVFFHGNLLQCTIQFNVNISIMTFCLEFLYLCWFFKTYYLITHQIHNLEEKLRKVNNSVQNTLIMIVYVEASEPKWVNHIFNIIGINSLRIGGLQSGFVTMSELLRNRCFKITPESDQNCIKNCMNCKILFDA